MVATELALFLAKRGHNVHLISYEAPVRYLDNYPSVNLHLVNVPSYPLFKYPPYLLALANTMVAVARQKKLDVFHVHYAIPHATAGVIARQVLGSRIPLITTLHGTDISLLGDDPSFYEVIEFSMNQSNALTAVSDSLRRETLNRFNLQVPIETIPNFVNPSVYHPQAHVTDMGDNPATGRKIVIHVSNFRPLKRVPLVVDIFAQAVTGDTDAELWLVGDGPDRGKVRQRVEQLGLSDRVRFWGEQARPERLIACADVMLLPSEQESFGLAALEAMACAVPVVATRVGGLVEVVEHDKSGFLHEKEDHAGMATSVRRILTEPGLKRRLGREGRRAVMEKFSPELIVSRYENLYSRVIANHTSWSATTHQSW